ncbi:hypothetical protein DL96DRAFT_1504808 [Flagelloscypha sp. PMI_526]|nr:hypothetical protein DL96DRAFT_1504808 [Flagelloscypha sp. PMI_526]
MPHDPPSRDQLFWIRTAPHPSTPNATKFANRYLRLHGDGVNTIMIMPSPPKFLRSHILENGQIVFTSWKHPGRSWCLDLSLDGLTEGARSKMKWHEAEIIEKEDSTKGFFFMKAQSVEVGKEGREQEELVVGDIEGGPQFGGWMVCDWKWNHPQLFWLTKTEAEGEDVMLPEGCEKVVLVKEALPEGAQQET